MAVLQTVTFAVLAIAFLVRLPRAITHREGRLTVIGTGVGALAIFTLGTIVPQEQLDAPLGGHNLLKLIQTSLALIAVWLGAQAAITANPTARRMNPINVAIMVALPAIPFLLIQRTDSTDKHFLDQNIRQLPAWLYASLYLAALAYIATRLFVAFRRNRALGAWLIKLGAAAIVIASIIEQTNFTIQLFTRRAPTAPLLSTTFNLVFYLGVCTMTLGIVAYTSTRAIRQWQVPRILQRLQNDGLAGSQSETRPHAPSQLGELYLLTVAIRDGIVSGELQLDHRQLRTLHRAERIIAHSLDEPLTEGHPTITVYTGKATP